ncbi:hypothetical protein LEMLEM_LOCUS27320 [Lemmus lemmus]
MSSSDMLGPTQVSLPSDMLGPTQVSLPSDMLGPTQVSLPQRHARTHTGQSPPATCSDPHRSVPPATCSDPHRSVPPSDMLGPTQVSLLCPSASLCAPPPWLLRSFPSHADRPWSYSKSLSCCPESGGCTPQRDHLLSFLQSCLTRSELGSYRPVSREIEAGRSGIHSQPGSHK